MRAPDHEWEWAESVRLWSEGDIGPLLEFVRSLQFSRSGAQLPDATAKELADIIKVLNSRRQTRSQRGRAPGTIHRWKDPHYVVAWWAECRIKQWKSEHLKDRIPDAVRDEQIAWAIAQWGGPKKLIEERIRRILRNAKSLRLPT